MIDDDHKQSLDHQNLRFILEDKNQMTVIKFRKEMINDDQ